MSDATSSDWGVVPIYKAEERKATPPKDSWPLMGDVLGCRGGVPEHLIQWRRAMGDEDPEPRL